jgi:prevent-host-death family protein
MAGRVTQRPPADSRDSSTLHARSQSEKTLSASSAKTHLLEILDDVAKKREQIVITKRGRPVARLIPIEQLPKKDIFGYMRGTFEITGDILSPEPDIWEAMS